MEKARLIQAFEWICPECGTQNFISAIQQEIDPDRKQEILDSINSMLNPEDDDDIEEGRELEYISIPDTVECLFCKRTLETVFEDEEDLDDLDDLDEDYKDDDDEDFDYNDDDDEEEEEDSIPWK